MRRDSGLHFDLKHDIFILHLLCIDRIAVNLFPLFQRPFIRTDLNDRDLILTVRKRIALIERSRTILCRIVVIDQQLLIAFDGRGRL